MAAGILNAVGNSRRSLMYLAVASFSNIFLDLWLIGGMHMGVEGAAIATDISQVLFCIMVFDESSGYLPHKSEETFH